MTSTILGPDDLVAVPHEQQKIRDTVSLLSVYLFLLMAIPSDEVFSPLGGAGAPSTILGVVFFITYLFKVLSPTIGLGRPHQAANRGHLSVRLAATFLGCAFIASYAAANLHKLDMLQQNAADRGLLMVAGWLGVLLLASDGISSLGRLLKLLDRIVFGAAGIALIGIIQFFTSKNLAKYITIPGLILHQAYSDIQVRGSYNRPQATTAHPIEFAFVLAAILPIAIHRARHAPKERRLARWTQVGLIAATLPLTVSRSGLMGLAVVMIVIVPVWSRRERLIALGVGLVGFVGVEAAVPGLLHTIGNLFLAIGSDSSTTSRTSAFSNAMPLIGQHPFFGIGFGTFEPQVYFYTDNEYLNSAIELGLVGMFALLTLFIIGWITARRTRRMSSDPEIRHLAQCMAASCAVILTVSSTFDMLYFAMAAGITFFMLGCIGALYRLTNEGNFNAY